MWEESMERLKVPLGVVFCFIAIVTAGLGVCRFVLKQVFVKECDQSL